MIIETKKSVKLPLVSSSVSAARPKFRTSVEAQESAVSQLAFNPAVRDRMIDDPSSAWTAIGLDQPAEADLTLFSKGQGQEAVAVACSPAAAFCVAYIAAAAVSYVAAAYWVAVSVGAFVYVAVYGSSLESGAPEMGRGYVSPV
jgi:hypothetical protein